MAREVTHEATSPLRLDEDDIEDRGRSVLICRCGLSREYPFCDGSHAVTRDEMEGVLYEYAVGEDGNHERREVVEVVDVAVDRDQGGNRTETGNESEDP